MSEKKEFICSVSGKKCVCTDTCVFAKTKKKKKEQDNENTSTNRLGYRREAHR